MNRARVEHELSILYSEKNENERAYRLKSQQLKERSDVLWRQMSEALSIETGVTLNEVRRMSAELKEILVKRNSENSWKVRQLELFTVYELRVDNTVITAAIHSYPSSCEYELKIPVEVVAKCNKVRITDE